MHVCFAENPSLLKKIRKSKKKSDIPWSPLIPPIFVKILISFPLERYLQNSLAAMFICVYVYCVLWDFFFHFECVRIYFRLVPYLLRFLSGHCTVINVEITHFKICIFFVFINAGMMYIAISYWLDFHMHIFILQYFFIENSIHSVIYFPICFRNIFIAKL